VPIAEVAEEAPNHFVIVDNECANASHPECSVICWKARMGEKFDGDEAVERSRTFRPDVPVMDAVTTGSMRHEKLCAALPRFPSLLLHFMSTRKFCARFPVPWVR
jgi:hypothetical protein